MSTVQSKTRESYEERILRVLSHIQTHLDDAISPLDLADLACFSPHHFHRIFRGMVGESVMGHIRRLRLERAAWRLKFTDLPVTRLAFEACYETHESFTRAFKERFGMAPRDFRATHRTLEFPAAPNSLHYHPQGEVRGFDVALQAQGLVRIRLESWPEREVAYMRHVGPYNEVGETWDRLCTWAAREGMLGPEAEMIGLCHDDPEVTPIGQVRYDACLAVKVDFTPHGDLGTAGYPRGRICRGAPCRPLPRNRLDLPGAARSLASCIGARARSSAYRRSLLERPGFDAPRGARDRCRNPAPTKHLNEPRRPQGETLP